MNAEGIEAASLDLRLSAFIGVHLRLHRAALSLGYDAVMRHRLIRAGATGLFVLLQDDGGEITTSWRSDELAARLEREGSRLDPRLLPDLARRLAAFFKGEKVSFDDVPLPPGGAFQRGCWRACRRIPRGETRSYAELAALAGSPKAFRAAGQAMRRNPLPVITPCHRVVGASGSLHGFGGTCDPRSEALAIKRALLEMEAAEVGETVRR